MTLMTALEPATHGCAAHVDTRTGRGPAAIPSYLDPLDDDLPSDEAVVTTKRAISRVALVATEAASRFQREGVMHDPMTWMMAPQVLFGGASALEACLGRDECMRAILLHGLSIGLDARPEAIDALAEDDDDAQCDEIGIETWRRNGDRPVACASNDGFDRRVPFDNPPRGVLRLFTATVVANDGFETVQAFHASLATEKAEIAGRLYLRMGAEMADAVIVEGFDPTQPLVESLVAPALCETLVMVAADPSSPLAAGLDLNVEQRFLN